MIHRKIITMAVAALSLASAAQAQNPPVTSCLDIFDLVTGTHTVIREFPFLIEAPNWSPDGKWLLVNKGGRLFRIAPDGQGDRIPVETGNIVQCNNDHVITADGRWIGLSSNDPEWKAGHNSFVYVVPFEGGQPRKITPVGPSYLHGISPDGKHIWFNSVRSGNMQVWRMNADGTSQTQLTFDHDRNSWFPHVSPDGKSAVYIAYRADEVKPGDHPANKHVQLRLIPYDGGTPQVLLDFFGGQGSLNVNSWNPESTKFAFVSYRLQ